MGVNRSPKVKSSVHVHAPGCGGTALKSLTTMVELSVSGSNSGVVAFAARESQAGFMPEIWRKKKIELLHA